MNFDELKAKHERIKRKIKRKMEEFRTFGQQAGRDDLSAEVAYCICTPQTPFEGCQEAIKQLQGNRLLFSGDEDVIALFLYRNKVRFHNVKGRRIKQTRAKLYDNGCPNPILKLVRELRTMPQSSARDRLYEIWVPGLGMKESSHFLRNIGHGDDLAMLDRHILQKLQEFRVVKTVPKTLTLGTYIGIEEKMRRWAKQIRILLGELDLLLWSEGTGEMLETLK